MPSALALSIVVPCYNESDSLPEILQRYAEAGAGTAFELVLVDNGSTDATPETLARLLPDYPFARAVRVPVNQGYGHGIFAGLQTTTAPVLAWSHADMQTDPADVFTALRLWETCEAPERTLVKGTRHGRALGERLISLAMQLIATVLLRTPLREINAQPKLFPRALLAELTDPPLDFNFDVYVLYRAARADWRIASIPVLFPPRQHGQSHWAATWRSKWRTILRSLRYLFRLARS